MRESIARKKRYPPHMAAEGLPLLSNLSPEEAHLHAQHLRRRAYLRSFAAGLLTPVAYVSVAMFAIDLLSSRGSAVDAIRHLDLITWLALAGYIGAVAGFHRVTRWQGYLQGVITMTCAGPLITLLLFHLFHI